MAADNRVGPPSFGSERDMLQKAYPLGPYIIGGFAGSVKIGFELLHSLPARRLG